LYLSIYIHKITKKNLNNYLVILKEAKDIYISHGVEKVLVYEPKDLSPKYGCSGLLDIIKPNNDEVLYLEFNHFNNKEHHDETMTKLDKIPRINELYNDLIKITKIKNIIRGEFSEI
jgi:uncharacterized protein YbaA (DUF1428 family)